MLVRIPGNAAIEIECVVDTGFEGFLTLPPAAIPVGIVSRIAKLELPYLARIDANLADNSSIATNVYLATIFWNGMEREIAILAMGTRPLIGTALLEDYHLSIDFCNGGTVLVDDIL